MILQSTDCSRYCILHRKYMFICEVTEFCWFVSEPLMIKSDCGTERDDIKREVTALSPTSSSASPVPSGTFSFRVPYQSDLSASCEFSVKSNPDVGNTDSSPNTSSTCFPAGNRCSEKFMLGNDLPVLPCPPLMFPEGLLTSSQNCSFGSGWSPYDKPLPPPPLLNLFCLPFHPSYSSLLPPLMSVPPPGEHPGGILSMQNVLARYAMSAARLPPLLRGFFPSNLTAQFPTTNPRPRLASKLPEVGVHLAFDDGAAGGAAARVEERRVSCDSTATSSVTDGGVTTSSESTSSPRDVSSTSDDLDCDVSDQQAPADLSDVTGSSLSSLPVLLTVTFSV